MAIIHILPFIEPGLFAKLGPAPARKKPQQSRAGRYPGAQPANNRIPDEVVLAVRRASEIERKTLRQVQQAFPQLEPTYIRRLLSYELRATLRVRR